MNNFFVLLKRFVPPYKKYVVLSLSLNLLSTIFSLFSFAAIIPVLRILFKLEENTVSVYREWTWNNGMTDIISALKNNLFYGIEQMIQQVGANMALLYLGLLLQNLFFLFFSLIFNIQLFYIFVVLLIN